MSEAKSTNSPHPDETNKKNEREASEGDKRTVENVRKNESAKEKSTR